MIKDESERRYSVLDCFGKADIGKNIVITMGNGRSESGELLAVGMFDIKIRMPNARELIVMKHALVTVTVMGK